MKIAALAGVASAVRAAACPVDASAWPHSDEVVRTATDRLHATACAEGARMVLAHTGDEKLKAPDDATIGEVIAEKQAALDAAGTSLREVRGIPELERGFSAARNAALLWQDIALIYFKLLQGLDVRAAVEKEIGDACGITAYHFAREAMERGKLCCISVPACR